MTLPHPRGGGAAHSRSDFESESEVDVAIPMAANRQHAVRTQRRPVQKNRPTASVSNDGNVPSLSMEPDMTVANLVSASSQSRRSRLAAAANPVLAGPSTSAVAVGETSGGDVA